MVRFRGMFRWVVVTAGVILLTSFTVDATLSPNGISQSALGILASRAVPEEKCPDGMVLITSDTKALCVDRFEASPSEACPEDTVESAIDSRTNIDSNACMPTAREGALPWVFVTFHQAKELCAKAGKRLPTSEEWYRFSIGTPDTNNLCNTASGSLIPSRESGSCVNGYRIYNAVGNAWEWVDGEVIDGSYQGRELPDSGYVINADRDGMATLTHPREPNPDLHQDYFWSDRAGDYGMLRGGFFGSGTDGGLYSIQAKTLLSLSSQGIGFRCVSDF